MCPICNLFNVTESHRLKPFIFVGSAQRGPNGMITVVNTGVPGLLPEI